MIDHFTYDESGRRVYNINILGQEFLFVGATRKDLEEALQFPQQWEMEDFICKRCIVSPKDFDLETCLAGIPTKLAELILDISGMSSEDTNTLQKEAQDWIVTPSGKMEVLMMGILHRPLAEIRNMDPIEWFKAAGAAQLLAVTVYGLDIEKYMSLNPFDSKPTAKRAKMPAANNPSGQIIPPSLVEISPKDLAKWEEENQHLITQPIIKKHV